MTSEGHNSHGSILTTDGAFDIFPSDLYLKIQNKMKHKIKRPGVCLCHVREKRDVWCVCVGEKVRHWEAQVSYIMGIPQAIGAAGELSLHVAPHSDIRIASMQMHTYASAENTERITMVAEISTKHVPRSGTFWHREMKGIQRAHYSIWFVLVFMCEHHIWISNSGSTRFRSTVLLLLTHSKTTPVELCIYTRQLS